MATSGGTPQQKLFPWQRQLIKDVAYGSNPYVVLEKSRRIGGTWSVAIAAVHYGLKHGLNGWFSSNDERNGREFIRYVTDYAKVMNALVGGERPFIDLETATTSEVTLPNGARVSALSGNPAALRGKDGLIMLDEVALRDDQEELVRVAQGCIIQRGKLVLLSTHDGPSTVFYRLAKEAEAGKVDWSHYKVTLLDAVDQGYALKFAKHLAHLGDPAAINKEFVESIRRSCISEAAFGQEFLCAPLSLTTLISGAEYDAIALWDVPDHLDPATEYRDVYVGIDVGRVHDLTVLWAVEQYENPKAYGEHDRYDYKTVCVREIHNEPIPVQHKILAPIVGHPSVRRCLIDQGSVGRSLSDSLCDEFADRCDPYGFTLTRKAELCERVKGYVQYQRVSLPKDDERCRTDMLAMRRMATKNGTLTYDGNTSFSHCDYFVACSMALEAACSDAGARLVVDRREAPVGEDA